LLGIASNEAATMLPVRRRRARRADERTKLDASRSRNAVSNACDARYPRRQAGRRCHQSSDALAEGINDGAALGDAVPPAVKSSVVVADDSVVPKRNQSILGAGSSSASRRSKCRTPGHDLAGTHRERAAARVRRRMTGGVVVTGVAAVGASLQAAATAPPRQREARVKRDNIVGYLEKAGRPTVDLLAGQRPWRERQRAVLRRAVLSDYYFAVAVPSYVTLRGASSQAIDQ
jgi:hypothetical protein